MAVAVLRWQRRRMPSTRSFAAALATAAALFAPTVAHAAPGDLDPTFDGDGRTTADLGLNETGDAVAYQPDGKILVAGQTRNDATGDFAVLRFNADGTPDKTFDGDGRTVVQFGPRDNATALALQPDGKIIVAGSTDSDASPATGSFSLAVARLNSGGVVDPTFNHGAGRQVIDFGGQELAKDVLVDPDGKIVVAGDGFKDGNSNFVWARLEDDGDLDKTFDGDGRATFDAGGTDSPAAAVVAPDGSIVTAGLTTANAGGGRNFAVVRLTSAGAPDNSFSGDGFAQVGFGDSDDVAAGLGVLPDGSTVVGGRSLTVKTADFVAARLTARGDLDPAYGRDGRARIESPAIEIARAATVGDDGSLVLAGATFAEGKPVDFAAGVLLPDGTPDPRFGGGRPVTVDFGGSDSANGVAVREGALALGGTTGQDIAVAQLVAPRPDDPFPTAPPQDAPAATPQAPPPAEPPALPA